MGINGLLGFPFQGGFFDELAIDNVLYVSSNGDDSNSGLTEFTPLRTIRAAADRATVGTTIFVRSGRYLEKCPIVLKENVSIIGDNLRTTVITPESNGIGAGIYTYLGGGQAPELNGVDNPKNPGAHVFLVNNGCYIAQLLFRGHSNFAIAFAPNAVITKSPYVQNCTSITDRGGGGMLIDGATASNESRIISMVLDAFTQINTDGGVGFLIKNEAYAQLVSCFGTFCYYHVKCESGGSCNLSNSVTDFGEIALYADGYAPNPYQDAILVNPDGFSKLISSRVNPTDPQPPLKIEFDGDSSVSNLDNLSFIPPVIASLFWIEVDGNPITNAEGDLILFGVLSATINQSDRTSVISSIDPFPQNVTESYLDGAEDTVQGHVNRGTLVRAKFHLRSIVASSGHSFEYAGSGINYFAVPKFGGQSPESPIGTTILEKNFGRVFFTGSDEEGNFRVGSFFQVDQLTGSTTVSVDNFDVTKLRSFNFQEDGNPKGTITGILTTSTEFQNDSGSRTLAVSSAAIKDEFNDRFDIQLRDLRSTGDITGDQNETYAISPVTDKNVLLVCRIDSGYTLTLTIAGAGVGAEPFSQGQQLLILRLGQGDVFVDAGNDTEIISSNDRRGLRALGSTAQLIYLGIGGPSFNSQWLLNGDLTVV